MEEINAPQLRLQMAISDYIRNRSLETLENVDFWGNIGNIKMIVGFIFHIQSHNKNLKRLAEHWIIVSICCEGDPRKVPKNLNAKVNATLTMGLENIDSKQYQPHPK